MTNIISRKGKREAKVKNIKKILLVFSPVKEVENDITPSTSCFYCNDLSRTYLDNSKTPSSIMGYYSSEINS